MNSSLFKNRKAGTSRLLSSSATSVKTHPYHLVDPSPWPALTSLSALWLAIGLVLSFHKYSAGGTVLLGALLTLVYTVSLWWRDVIRESRSFCHTSKVKQGLQLGMYLFIVSEAMFFVGLIWAFLNAALMPTVQVGMAWPPVGIIPIKTDTWHDRPILNTWLLLASYFTANAAKHALDNGNKQGCANYLILTILLGAVFSFYQYLEYNEAAFTFSDSIFGSSFYLTTGFHGAHVIIGFLYLAVCLFNLKDASKQQSTALNLATLYWHFVDIIWILVLVLLYFWNGSMPEPDYGGSNTQTLHAILHATDLDNFLHKASYFI